MYASQPVSVSVGDDGVAVRFAAGGVRERIEGNG